MYDNVSETPTQPQILGSFTLVTGLLGIFCYFTGWIYRWAYFGFFQIEVNSLNLSLESFLFVPLQVFLGSYEAFLKTVLAVVMAIVLIRVTLWLLLPFSNSPVGHSRPRRSLFKKIIKWLRSPFATIPQPLGNEVVIVIWLLVVLFWLARIQGTSDARRDAINNTSLRPVVTFVTTSDRIGLGRKFDERLTHPSLANYQIIGDKRRFDDLRKQDINNFLDPKEPTVWRLLVETNGWIYVFPALPANSQPERRPPILAIRESGNGDQLMILAPEAEQPNSK